MKKSVGAAAEEGGGGSIIIFHGVYVTREEEERSKHSISTTVHLHLHLPRCLLFQNTRLFGGRRVFPLAARGEKRGRRRKRRRRVTVLPKHKGSHMTMGLVGGKRGKTRLSSLIRLTGSK